MKYLLRYFQDVDVFWVVTCKRREEREERTKRKREGWGRKGERRIAKFSKLRAAAGLCCRILRFAESARLLDSDPRILIGFSSKQIRQRKSQQVFVGLFLPCLLRASPSFCYCFVLFFLQVDFVEETIV